MKNSENTSAKIFLTDYASYNNGSQFEFGHWVELNDFSDAEELNEYIINHFAECDEESPLDSPREEIMITDFEGFPEEFYSESGCNFEKIFKYIELDFENLSDGEKLGLWNEYCSEERSNDEIWDNDEEFFNIFFDGKVLEAVRAVSYGEYNYSDDYVRFNGYGNLESFNNATDHIDEAELLNWMMENK